MPAVCLVIPCFNEAHRLRASAVLSFLREQTTCRICFVDDGSADETPTMLTAIAAQAPDRIEVLRLEVNRGKAEAVRHGMLHVAAAGACAYIGYWDADLATPFRELPGLVAALEARPAYVLAMGSRWKRLGAAVERRPMRHLLGRVFATLASAVLTLPVYDSQCGAKVFRSHVVAALFHEPFLTRWLFDVELLARLIDQHGRGRVLESVVEVPLNEWRETPGSKLTARHMARMPIELLSIRRRYAPKR